MKKQISNFQLLANFNKWTNDKIITSCKKLKLEDLGYSCSDLESQTISKIDKIK